MNHNYNECVDHLVSTMPSNSQTDVKQSTSDYSTKDVTNSIEDWMDFWYNSEDIYPPNTMTNSQQNEPPFDNDAYDNYVDQINKYKGKSLSELTQIIMKLGFKLDQQLAKIIKQLDTIIEEEKDNK